MVVRLTFTVCKRCCYIQIGLIKPFSSAGNGNSTIYLGNGYNTRKKVKAKLHADRRNNVEQVTVSPLGLPLGAYFIVRIKGQHVPGDGTTTRQPFALVASGSIEEVHIFSFSQLDFRGFKSNSRGFTHPDRLIAARSQTTHRASTRALEQEPAARALRLVLARLWHTALGVQHALSL